MPDAPASSRIEPAATAWPGVAALIGAGVIATLPIGEAPVALPATRAELGAGLAGAGWLVSMFNLQGAIARPCSAPWPTGSATGARHRLHAAG